MSAGRGSRLSQVLHYTHEIRNTGVPFDPANPGDPKNLNVLGIADLANAYGSILGFVLGLHTTQLATDVGDSIVLTVLMFTRHATPRRFGDVTDNAFYWAFVVIAWLPLYVLLYWVPRL